MAALAPITPDGPAGVRLAGSGVSGREHVAQGQRGDGEDRAGHRRRPHPLGRRARPDDRLREELGVGLRRGRDEAVHDLPGERLVGAAVEEGGLGHLELGVPAELGGELGGVPPVLPVGRVGAALDLGVPPSLQVADEALDGSSHRP